MNRIQITNEISESLVRLERASQASSDLSISKRSGFAQNQLSSLERYARMISEVGNLSTRYDSLLQTDIKKAEALIENARNQDADWARVMEGSLS